MLEHSYSTAIPNVLSLRQGNTRAQLGFNIHKYRSRKVMIMISVGRQLVGLYSEFLQAWPWKRLSWLRPLYHDVLDIVSAWIGGGMQRH